MQKKTNKGLVEYAYKMLNEGWSYLWGTYGLVVTETLVEQKLKQYPTEVGRYIDFIRQNHIGKRAVDCIGSIKSYLWYDEDTDKIKYNPLTDYNANGIFNRAKVKGSIDTMPEVLGLCVGKIGHVGIYVGNGKVIEARGTKYGVIMSPLKGTGSAGWTRWCECPDIEYIKDTPIQPTKPTLRLGSKDEAVVELQKNLLTLGYDLGKWGADGYYGKITATVIGQMQEKYGLKPIDGVVGKNTYALIDRLIEEKNKLIEQPKQEENPTLRFGDNGEKVKLLQTKLNAVGYKLKVDGDYGTNTKDAVIRFQEKNNLDNDGVCGAKTWEVLLKGGKNISESVVRKDIQYKEYKDKNGYKTYMIICKPENIEIKLFKDTLFNAKQVGINGTYFDRKNPFLSKSCWGLAVNNGKPIGENAFLVSWDSSIRRGVVAWDGKNMILKRINKYTDISNMVWGISGIDLIDFSKTKDKYLEDVYRTAQRTTIGFDLNNNVYLIVNEKQTIQQQIQMCKDLGIKGISLDSGGSSQLYFDGKGYKSSRKVNNIVAVKEL